MEEKNGELEEKRKVAIEMLNKGMDIKLISEITKLSEEEIEKLKEKE